MYTSLMIANTVALENPGRFTAVQMGRIVQTIQGWGLGYDMDVCVDLPVCLQYGPAHDILVDVYRALDLGTGTIPGPVCPPGGTMAPIVPSEDHRARRLISRVVEIHRDEDDVAANLRLTGVGTPWYNAYAGRLNKRRHFGTTISRDVLRTHYRDVVEKAQADALRDMRAAA